MKKETTKLLLAGALVAFSLAPLANAEETETHIGKITIHLGSPTQESADKLYYVKKGDGSIFRADLY